MAPKTVLFQIAKGDQTASNPTTTAILRAGDLADWTLYYRHDHARAENSALPLNPHGFAVAVASSQPPLYRSIALGAQDQAGQFFFSDGGPVTVPQPNRFFEFPIVLPLPEGLNYIIP
jgi:hypothetical protein